MNKKEYKCTDCNRLTDEYRRLSIKNSFGKVIYKCPYCRGKLEFIKDKGGVAK